MTTLREAAQQALKILENGAIACPGWVPDYDDAITSLRAALAEQDDDLTAAWMAGAAEERKRAEQAQPVAWAYKGEPFFDGDRWHDQYGVTTDERVAKFRDKDATPLYSAPPAPVVPQPLSGLDVERLLEDVVGSLPVARKLIRAVEAEVLKRVGVQR